MKRLSILALLLLTLFGVIACQTTTTPTTETTQSTLPTSETTVSTMTTLTSSPLLQTIELLNETPRVNELLEIAFFEPEERIIETQYNPYDYREIKVLMNLTAPSGKQYPLLAFWYRPYDSLQLVGGSVDELGYFVGGQEMVRWKEGAFQHYLVRFLPKEVGLHSYQVVVYLGETIVQTIPGTFSVAAASKETPGYIQVDSANNKNFIFDNQTSYFPMGVNLGWWSTTKASHDYANWFKKLSENDANYARIWLANWSFSLHKDSYQRFDTRQNIAIRLDHVFSRAEQYGIYIMLTLINHGQFSAVTNPEWAENVYNKANGGMLDVPIQFFYNAEAKAWYKNELLYLIGRYGYSEHLFAWELFNEVDWIDGYSSIAVTQWHSEMAQFLHANDPFEHMVSTSYKYTFGNAAYSLDSIDFGAVHSYAYYDVNFYQKYVGEIQTLWNRYQKPIFFGEIGIDWQSGHGTYHTDYTGVTIRQAAWGGLMASAGGGHHWWWDSWFDAYDMWPMLKGASSYAKQLDLANENHQYLHEDSSIQISHPKAKILGYRSKGAIYGYVYHHDWNYWNRTPAAIHSLLIQIPLSNGTYQVQVFNTLTGAITSTQTIEITSNAWVLEIETLTEDYAFTLKPIA